MGRVRTFTVVTDKYHAIEEVTDDLREAGLSGVNVMAAIRTVTGEADEEALVRLRAVPGVVDVSASGVVSVGPPGAKTTW